MYQLLTSSIYSEYTMNISGPSPQFAMRDNWIRG